MFNYHSDKQMFNIIFFLNMNNFYPLEVVGRGSETQLEVGKHQIR